MYPYTAEIRPKLTKVEMFNTGRLGIEKPHPCWEENMDGGQDLAVPLGTWEDEGDQGRADTADLVELELHIRGGTIFRRRGGIRWKMGRRRHWARSDVRGE
jgi:hypothetical protein